MCSSRTPVASVVLVETASCPSRMPVATMAMDETASCPSQMPVATMAMDETASRPSRMPVAALATDETAQAVALPCFPSCRSVAPSFLRDLNNNKKPDLGSSLVSSKLGALVHQMMVGGGMPVAAVAIVETASCPSRIPVATLAADETASCPSPTPVATLAVDELVRRQLPVAALATDETVQAVSSPRTPFVAIAGAKHPSPDISGSLESLFYFSCGFCVDLRASARRDWLSGCSVARGCGAGRSSWVPVATLAADEAAVCSSTGRSVAHGCGLGCSWEWQAAALRLGRRFGHHGCGG